MSGLTRKQVGRSQAAKSSRPHRKSPQFRPFSGSNDKHSIRTAAAAETLGKVVGVELIDASTQSYAVTVDIDGKQAVGTVSSSVVSAGDSVSVSVLESGTLSIKSIIPDNIQQALAARIEGLKAAGQDVAELEKLAEGSSQAAEAAEKQALLAQADAQIKALEQADEGAQTQADSLLAAFAKLQAQYSDAPEPLSVNALTYTGQEPPVGIRDELVALLDLATEDIPFQAGEEVTGVVVSSHVNGVIVDLGEGVRGLLPTADLKVPSAKASSITLPPFAVELKTLLAAVKSGDEEAIQAAAAPILARKEAIFARAEELLAESATLCGDAIPEAAESEAALKSSLTPESYSELTAQLSALKAIDVEDPATVRAALVAVNGDLPVADADDDIDDDEVEMDDGDVELDNSAYLDADSSEKLYGYQALSVADASTVYSAGDEIAVYVKDVSSGYIFLSQYSPLEEKHTALADAASFIEEDLPELAEQVSQEAFGGALAAGIDLRPAQSEGAFMHAQLEALDKALATALPPADKARLDIIKHTVLLGGGLSFADEAFLASLSPVLGNNKAVRELVGIHGAELSETAALAADEEAILADIAALAGEETAESLRAFHASDLFNIEIDETADAAEVDRIMALTGDALQAEIAKVLGSDAPAVPGANPIDIFADLKAVEKAAGIDLAAEMAALLGDDADAVLQTDLTPLSDDVEFGTAVEDAGEDEVDLGDLGDLSGEDAETIAAEAKKAMAAEESATDRKYDMWDMAMEFAAKSDMAVDEAEEDIIDLVESNMDDDFAEALAGLERVSSAPIYEALASADSADSTADSATVAAMHVFAASVGVSAAEVKALRDATGAGMMDCKRALIENAGDAAKATEYLRQKGLLSAGKKAGRVAAEGLIKMYVHPDARFGVLLEVNCETDFVAGNDKFYELVDELCVALLPDPTIRFVSVEEVSPELIAKEREIESCKEDLAGKPEAVKAKMVEGRVQKNLKEQSLLEAKWWKDDSKTVAAVLKEAISTLGENIKIRRFQRITLGEGLAKKEDNLANEVAQVTQAQPKAASEPKKEEPKKVEAAKPPSDFTVSAKEVKALRDATGAGMMDCKRALIETVGDATLATEWLRKKGLASAVKKAGRAAAEGLITGYIHPDCRFGLLVEVNCETDFVAGNEKFYQFAQSIAVSIASNKEIQYVSYEDIPKEVLEAEKAAALANPDLEGKPEEIKMKIVEGRVAKAAENMTLMNQPFVYDPEKTVEEVVKEAISTLGENIKIRRFLRYDLGSGIEKKQSDLAAEVAAMTG